jgi:hypothetical protein
VPGPERFAERAGHLGIGPETHVVVYAHDTPMWATRMWWLLRYFGFDGVTGSGRRLKRESLGGARGDVDQELGSPPTLVLLCVDEERCAPDLAELQVLGSGGQFAVLQAQWRGAVAAAPRLEERQRPVTGPETLDHLERRRGSINNRPTTASHSLHL